LHLIDVTGMNERAVNTPSNLHAVSPFWIPQEN
jgi:hypothetical protein